MAAAALALIHLLLAALVFDPTLHSGGDNAAYLSLARSLIENGRYLTSWDPTGAPHLQYPPGFPVLLSIPMALGVEPWPGFKILVMLTSGLAVALSYLWARTRTGPTTALGIGLVVAAAPGVLGQSHWILSDVPFWTATMAALLAAGRGRPGWGVTLAFVALTFRTAGLPLVLAFAAWFGLRRRWRSALAVGLGLVALVGMWMLRARGVDAPYVSAFWLLEPYDAAAGTVGALGLAARIADNAGRYAFGLLGEVLVGHGGTVADIGMGVVLTAAAIGYARIRYARTRATGSRAQRTAVDSSHPQTAIAGQGARDVADVWLPIYIAVLLLWPATWASERFLLPIVPVLLILAADGTRLLADRPGRFAGLLGMVLLLVAGVPDTVDAARSAATCRRLAAPASDDAATRCLRSDARAFLALAAWSRDRLPDGAAVVSRKPTLFHWFSGYPGRTYPFSREPGVLIQAMDSAGARYVVMDEMGATARAYLLPALRRDRQRFCLAQVINAGDSEATLLGLLPASPEQRSPGPVQGDTIGLDFPLCPAGYVRLPSDPRR